MAPPDIPLTIFNTFYLAQIEFCKCQLASLPHLLARVFLILLHPPQIYIGIGYLRLPKVLVLVLVLLQVLVLVVILT